MTKDVENILKRLIDQGHITWACVDRILNKKEGYIRDLADLHRDGPMSTSEALILLATDFHTNEVIVPADSAKSRQEHLDTLWNMGHEVKAQVEVKVPNNMTNDWRRK